jgi:hypothetical protein
VGEFGNLQDAIARLKVIIPITLLLIAVLLLLTFGSAVDMLLTMSAIPMTVTGGVFALSVTGIPFSVSAAIGFVALFGVSVMEGIIILSQYNRFIDAGLERWVAAMRAGDMRMRPVLMTCVIAGVGLLPAALSTGIGSQGEGAGRSSAGLAGRGRDWAARDRRGVAGVGDADAGEPHDASAAAQRLRVSAVGRQRRGAGLFVLRALSRGIRWGGVAEAATPRCANQISITTPGRRPCRPGARTEKGQAAKA